VIPPRRSNGIAKVPSTAIQWFEKAADQGWVDAQLELGNIYYFGEGSIQKNYARAAKWMTLAANQGNPSAENALGVMNENGFGMAKNEKQALQWFTKAAEANEPRAQWNLGRIYMEGQFVKQNPVLAYKWLKISNDNGDMMAQHLLPDFLGGGGVDATQKAQGDREVREYESAHPIKHPVSSTAPPRGSMPVQ
jgi:TPR repeat protein